MANLKLSPCGDIAIDSGRLTLVSGLAEIQQNWLIRVRTVLGEWWLDSRIGVPFFGAPLDGGRALTDKQASRARFQEVIARITRGTPGVLRVESVVIDRFDTRAREAEITVTARVDAPEGSATFRFTGGACTPEVAELDYVVIGSDDVYIGGDRLYW